MKVKKSPLTKRRVEAADGQSYTIVEAGQSDIPQNLLDLVLIAGLRQAQKNNSRKPFILTFPINTREKKSKKK